MGPTGPAGWYQDRPAHRNPRTPPPHPLRPLQGLRGPLRWVATGVLLAAASWVAGWVLHPVYPPGTPTRSHTHPRYTLAPHHPKVSNLGAYSTFGTLVGEPRGSRTHRYNPPQTSQGGLYTFLRFYTAI